MIKLMLNLLTKVAPSLLVELYIHSSMSSSPQDKHIVSLNIVRIMLKNKLHINWSCLTQVLYCRASIAAASYISAISFMGITLCLSLTYSKFYPLLPPKNLPFILFYSHIVTYYFHFVLLALLLQVLTSRGTLT